MSDESLNDMAVGRQDLFRLIADEAFRDGLIEPHENALLQKMARFLRLSSDEAKEIALEARARFKAGTLGEERSLNPEKLYEKVLEAIEADGVIDRLEEQMLLGLRQVLGLNEESTAEVASPHVKPESKLPKQPKSGSTTTILEDRLSNDIVGSWTTEQCFWYPLVKAASEEARAAWFQFLQGVKDLNEDIMYQGLDRLDDVLNSLEGVNVADAALTVGALRWSRVLLRTQFSSMESGPARDWPGRKLYQRLCIKIVAPLISINHFPPQPLIRGALDLAMVDLLEDLAMLVETRRSGPVRDLSFVIPNLAAPMSKSLVLHLAAPLFESWAKRLGRQEDREMTSAFVALCSNLCTKLPQNHPLFLAADNAVGMLDPKKKLLPEGKQPPGVPKNNGCMGPAQERIKHLVAEAAQRDKVEHSLISGLSKLNLAAVDAVQMAATDTYTENSMKPENYLFRNVVLLVLPEIPNYPRPVVAYFCLGNSSGHHEELKGSWVPLVLSSLDEDRLQVLPEHRVFPSTCLLSLPLPSEECTQLRKTLHSSGGAYDVALIDGNRKAARIWNQCGDLDPSGAIHKVERELLPAKKSIEARQCLDDALESFPWLSQAWLHKGIMAKKAGDLDGAQAAFESALEVQPHNPHTMIRLGVLAKGQSDMTGAGRWLDQALRICPTELSALVTLTSIDLGRLLSGESAALPRWDVYYSGLYESDSGGNDFAQIRHLCLDNDRNLNRISPVNCAFYC